MQTITPFLWFNDDAETVMNYYLSIFPDGKIIQKMPGPEGKPMGGAIELLGQRLIVLNGGPVHANFTEAISLFVSVGTQEEIDNYWGKLIADGGQESQCGWLKDKYGLSWQIVPNALGEMLGSPDREKANRAMQAMLKMKKIVIADLKKAYEQE